MQILFIYNIDGAGPEITINPMERDWINEPINVSISANDKMSELTRLQYSISDNDTRPEEYSFSTEESNASVELTEDGIWYIHAEAYDTVDNVSYKMGGPYKIDQVKPTIVLDPEKKNINGAAAYNSSIQAKLTVTDDRSGIGNAVIKEIFTPYIDEVGFGSPVTTYRNITNETDGDIELEFKDMGRYEISIEATDKAGNKQTKKGIYNLVPNLPPELDILGTTPSFIYEGDDVYIDFQVNDLDFDTLDCNIKVERNGSVVYNKDIWISPNGTTYPPISHLLFTEIPYDSNDKDNNEYEVKITVKDGFGGEATGSYDFEVHDLFIVGSVYHTEEWKGNLDRYNKTAERNGEDTREETMFFPGERFVLQGNASNIDSDRIEFDGLKADEVTVKILDKSLSTTLTKKTATMFNGFLWNSSMINWVDQPLNFLFTVKYSNGHSETDTVRVYIKDDEYWRLHMRF